MVEIIGVAILPVVRIMPGAIFDQTKTLQLELGVYVTLAHIQCLMDDL